MIDINTILTQALTTAVVEATKPLVERIAALEAQLAQAQAAPAPAPRAWPCAVPTQVQEAVYAYLDDSESFWHRIAEFVNARVSSAAEQIIAEAIDAHLEQTNHLDEDDIGEAIDSAIENHEENRTHGDEDDIEELVQKLLNGATISISV
jgi:hypothetical protein